MRLFVKKISSVVFFAFVAILFFAGAKNAFAAMRTASVSGNWSSSATWGGAAVPTASDTCIVNNGVTVTVDATAACANLTINAITSTGSNGVAISGTNSLTIGGAIVMNAPTAYYSSVLSVGAGTLNAASVSIIAPNDGGHSTILSVSSGTINVSGNITFSGTYNYAQLTFTGAGILNIGGTLGTGGTLTPSTGTINYNGTGAQTINAYTYNNLTLSGSGTKTSGGAIVANGNLVVGNGVTFSVVNALTVTGTTTVGGGTSGALSFLSDGATMTFGGLVTINAGANWTENAEITFYFSNGITNNGTFTGGLGTYKFQTNSQTLNGTISIPNIYVIAALTNNGTLTVSSAYYGSGSFTNTGTFNANFAGTTSLGTLIATATGNTVNYGYAGAQTVKAVNYYNLTLSGSGIKTIYSVVSFGGTLAINGAAQALLTIGNFTANQLILGGAGQVAGTWGSSNSSPVPGHITNTYFALSSGFSGYVTVSNNPVPAITSISPASANVGSAGFTLTVTGTNFTASSVVKWNSNSRTTTFVSSTVLTAVIPASDISNLGTASVTVTNPSPGGGTSSGLTCTVQNPPAPTITSIAPTSAYVGGVGFTITVTGTNFTASSIVEFNSNSRTTTFVSSTVLTAVIPSSDLINAEVASITVVNPSPYQASNGLSFTISNPPAPTITSIAPTSTYVGSSGFTMTVTGTNFTASSIVEFNSNQRTTTFVSSTQLTATIPASDLINIQVASITVVNLSPYQASNGQNFTISSAPTQTATSIVLTSSATSSGYGNSVTFTAIITPAAGGPPTGTVTFKDGAATLGTGTLNGANPGVATFSTSTLSVSGSPHSITAVYGGDSTFSGSTSSAVSEIITAKNLTVTGITTSNKTYDATTTATLVGAPGTLVGVVAGDTVSLTGSAIGTFATPNIGTGITVTVNGQSLTGAQALNYSFTEPTTTANITAKSLTVSGVTGSTKVYDASTTAVLNVGGAALVGVISGDTVSLNTGSAVGTFATSSVGAGIVIQVSGLTVSGPSASNYSLIQPTTTGTITAKNLTVTGITATNKSYDASTTAVLIGAPGTLVGVVSGDAVSLTGTALGVFATSSAGTGITVTVSGQSLSGSKSANYILTEPTTTANITAKNLAVLGITANDKVYDRTTSSTLNVGSAALAGVISGDTVTLNTAGAVGTFATSSTGTGISVLISSLTISGFSSPNYLLVQPTTTANITAKSLTVTGITAQNKSYDASTTATLNLGSASLVGVVAGDAVTLGTGSAAGTFATSSVGTGISVAVSGLTISGSSSSDYSLTQPTTTANILQATSSVTVTCPASELYTGSAWTPCTASYTTADGLSGSSPVTYAANTNVGTATASSTYPGDTNHAGSTNTATFAITPATTSITLNSSATSSLYGSSVTFTATVAPTAASGTVTFKDGSVTIGTAPLVAGSATFATSTLTAGSPHSITAVYAGNGNFSGSTSSIVSQTITAKVLTISGITANNKTYDATTTATLSTGSATLIGVIAGDTVVVNTGSAVGTFATSSVGTGMLVTVSGLAITGVSASNYSLTQPTTTAAITAKNLTVTGITANKIYDGTTSTTFNLSGASLVGVIAGDVVTLNTAGVAGSFADKNVGTNKSISVSGLALVGANASNYTITQPTVLATITARNLIVSAIGTNKVYDGTASTTVTLSDNRVVGDVLSLSYSSATFADQNIGIGKTVSVTGISVTGTDSGNYSANATATTTANITAKPITVTANPVSKVYGAADPVFTYVSSDASSTFTGSLGRVAGENVGTYALTQGTLAASSNYSVTFVSANLTITAAVPTTISITPPSTIVGSPDFVVTVSGTNFVPNAVVNFNGAAESTTFVSVTQLTATILASDVATVGNYLVTVVNPAPGGGTSDAQTFTVNKATQATLTVTGLPTSAVYAQAGINASTAGGNGTGVVTFSAGSSTACSVAISTGVVTITSGTGTCSITATKSADTNYNATTSVSVSIAISLATQAPLIAIATPSTVSYGATSTLSSSGGSGTGAITWSVGASTGCTISNGTTLTNILASGTCQVTATKAADANYNAATSSPITVTLTPKNITVTAIAATKVFGNTDPTFTYAPSDLGAIFTGLLGRVAGESVGVYAITQGSLSAGVNYSITFVSADLTITQATSSVIVSCPASETYTGSAITPCSASYLTSDGLNGSSTVTYANNVNVGTAIASSTYAGDANHAASSNAASFTISTATSSVVVSCPALVVYTGSTTSPCTASYLTSDGLSGSLVVAYSSNMNVGTASASSTYAGDSNHVSSFSSATFTITQATSSVTVSCPASEIYTSSALAPCAASYLTSDGTSGSSTVVYSSNINVGMAAASSTYIGDANHQGNTNSANFSIVQATSSVTVTCPASESYTGSAITPCSASYLTSDGLNGSSAVTYTNNVNVGTATASSTYAGDANHAASSNAATFSIGNALPALTSLLPTSTPAGSADFTLTVDGSNFIVGSVVNWNGSARTTSFVSSTELTATIVAADVSATGTAALTVTNPAPGGGTSNAQTFTITATPNPVPVTTGIGPTSTIAGSADFTLTVDGSNFISDSVVQWNDSPRTTTFVSSSSLIATISASDVAFAGTVPITVMTPTPGGGISNTQTFTIENPISTSTNAIRFIFANVTSSAVVGNGVVFNIEAVNSSGTVDASFQQGVTLTVGGSGTGGGLVTIIDGIGTSTVSDNIAQTITLSLEDSQLTGLNVSSTAPVIFLPGPVLKFTLNHPGNMNTGTRLGYTIGRQDQFGNSVSLASDTVAYLYSNSSSTNAAFFDAATGGTQISSTTILDGSTSTVFWYYDDTPGSRMIIVSDNASAPDGAAGIVDASDTFMVAPGAVKFIFANVPSNVTAGSGVTANIYAVDSFDTIDPSFNGGVTVTTSGSATGGGLITIVNGVGTTTITDATAETVTLGLQDTQSTGLGVGATTQTVFNAIPVVTPSISQTGGGSSPEAVVSGIKPGVTITFSGMAYPGASVMVIRKDLGLQAMPVTQAVPAAADGSFLAELDNVTRLTGQTYLLSFVDKNGLIAQTKAYNVPAQDKLVYGNILAAPTLGFQNGSISAKGKPIVITGYATPAATVELFVDGNPAGTVTIHDPTGKYSYTINTDVLATGRHAIWAIQKYTQTALEVSGYTNSLSQDEIFVDDATKGVLLTTNASSGLYTFVPAVTDGAGGAVPVTVGKTYPKQAESDFSNQQSFTISPLANPKLDLNGDGVVDVRDLSIFLAYLKNLNTSLTNFRIVDPNMVRTLDFNGDGVVDINDLNILSSAILHP